MDVTSDRRRVHTAILLYLLVFFALNAYVWLVFLIHRHGPHIFPLGERVERFGDLVRFSGKYQVWKDHRMEDGEHLSGTLFPQNYPAFSVVIYLFLLQVCAPYALPVMLGVIVVGVAVACVMLWRKVRVLESYRWYMGVGIFATGLFGWATEQVMMRGNIEGIMWIFVCLGAGLYAQRRYSFAGAAFGVAACVKPYPLLWLLLMARHRKYKEVAIGVLAAAAVTLASLLTIDRNPFRAQTMITGKSTFFEHYVVAFRPMLEMRGDHSFFQSMKTIARIVRYHSFTLPLQEMQNSRINDPLAWKLYTIYMVIAAVGGLLLLWKMWNKPVLNQMFAVACVCTLMPPVAADYTLGVILIPMGFLLVFLLQDAAVGRVPLSLGDMLWFLLPCAWIMGTEPLVLLHAVFKCIALLVLLGAAVVIPLPSTLFDEKPV